jgi:NAD(P)H-flavin reductase
MEALGDTMMAVLRPEPMEPVPHRVVARTVDSPRVVTVRVIPVDQSLAVPQPGQFMMIWVFGVGEVPISVSDAGADGWMDFTVQTAGATSAAINATEVGDVIGLRGPFGTVWPVSVAGGRDVVVMAGGLGLAPLRMAIDVMISSDPSPRSITILVGAREPASLLYHDDLARWATSGVAVRATVDIADRTWPGAVGVVTTLLDRELVVAELAFVCGPEVMMTASVNALMKAGMAADQIHVSLERNMHCGIAHCGRCQLGPLLLCRDGAVVCWDLVADLVAVRGR